LHLSFDIFYLIYEKTAASFASSSDSPASGLMSEMMLQSSTNSANDPVGMPFAFIRVAARRREFAKQVGPTVLLVAHNARAKIEGNRQRRLLVLEQQTPPPILIVELICFDHGRMLSVVL
jgi:hypothetical protein